MNIAASIKIKSAFLLTVFSLNTLMGFACAMGLDMGYNKSHHTEEATEVLVHVHADGKKHHHENEPKKSHHDEPITNHHDKKDASKKDDCCTGDVLQFNQLDKSLAAKVGIDIPVFVAIVTVYFGINIFETVQLPAQKYTAPHFHPPPPDICIAIQRFQI